jgi:hypothetical protein
VDVPEARSGRFESFDANERFVVIRDDEGYGVWRLEDLEDGEPLERFTDDDDGYEAAARRWKQLTRASRGDLGAWMGRLRVVIVGGLSLWVASSAVPAVEAVVEEGGPFSGGIDNVLERVAYAVSAISFDLWTAATVAYVVLWMELRRRAPDTQAT